MMDKGQKKLEKILKKCIKTHSVKEYLYNCKEKYSVDAFMRDYSKYNHITLQNDNIAYLPFSKKAGITSSDLLYLLMHGKTTYENESIYFMRLSEKDKEKYFIYIINQDDFEKRYLYCDYKITEKILDEAIFLGKAKALISKYRITDNKVREKLIEHCKKNGLNPFNSFKPIEYKLKTDDLYAYLKLVLDQKDYGIFNMKTFLRNRELCIENHVPFSHTEYGNSIDKICALRLSPSISSDIDLSKIRNLIFNYNELVIGTYIWSFKDFEVDNERFLSACKVSYYFKDDFASLSELELSKLSKDQIKMILKCGKANDKPYMHYNNNNINHLEKIDNLKSILTNEIVDEVINELVDEIKDISKKFPIKPIREYREDAINNINDKLNRIIMVLEYTDYNKHLKKIIDLLIYLNGIDTGYYSNDPGCIDFINPLDVITKYRIKDKNINDRIINYILGEGNEANEIMIKKYEEDICKIKYLDDNNILKIAPYFINNSNKYVYDFMNMVNEITDIRIIKDIVLQSNDLHIATHYMYLAHDKELIRKYHYHDDSFAYYYADVLLNEKPLGDNYLRIKEEVKNWDKSNPVYVKKGGK